MGIYSAYEPKVYVRGILYFVPTTQRVEARRKLVEIQSALSYWIIGRMLSMLLVGVLTGIGLWILGVPLPATLGAIAALLTFIPNIGPLVAAVPQALLAMQSGIDLVVYVLLFNLCMQTGESYLITPLIQRYVVRLPPALTISLQALIGVVAGIVGVMAAAPLAVAFVAATKKSGRTPRSTSAHEE